MARPHHVGDPNYPQGVVTDYVLAVSRGIKGPEVKRVIVTQPGGKIGDFDWIAEQVRPLKPGERYILFLRSDGPVQKGSTPRFVVAYRGHGIFVLENSLLMVSRDSAMQAYAGKPVDFLLQDVARAMLTRP